MALNQHINQRTTNDTRLTAHKHVLAIQIITDRVENLHNAKRSTWLKFGCGIKAINIKLVWNIDILWIDMFWQWKLNNNTIHILKIIIL